MKPFLRWCFVATALTLAGCSNSAWRKSEVLAVPLQPTLQQEVILGAYGTDSCQSGFNR